MNLFFCILFSIFQISYAHMGHDKELKSIPRLTDASIFQLNSTWKNQKGESIKLPDLRGKPRLLIMLYTKCETSCPLIVEDLKQISRELNSKEIEVSLFSFDSARETPKSLLDFADKRKLPSDWTLFTSDANAVAELAAALGVRYKHLQNGDYIHSNVIFFINDQGEIVTQKEGLKTSSADFIKKIKQTLKTSDELKKSSK